MVIGRDTTNLSQILLRQASTPLRPRTRCRIKLNYTCPTGFIRDAYDTFSCINHRIEPVGEPDGYGPS